MENSNNYSDEWQPYIGDYDKFEYDVKLKDGTIVENCYPNGGIFNSISGEHNKQGFDENDVVEIRFSQKPRYGINEEVSEVPQYEWLDRNTTVLKLASIISATSSLGGLDYFYLNNSLMPKFKSSRGIRVEVRTEPKIGRNEVCPKCDSGKKYKNCCKSKL